MGQFSKALQPTFLGLPKRLHILPAVSTADHSADSDDDAIQKTMPCALWPLRVFEIAKVVRNVGWHRIRHGAPQPPKTEPVP